MKKKIFLYLLLLLTITLSGCNSSMFSKCRKDKGLDYQYVGLYINFIDEQNKCLDDSNVKLYIDKLNKDGNDILVCRNNLYQYNCQEVEKGILKNTSKDNENDLIFYSNLQVSISSMNDINQLDVYPIILKDGSYIIKTDEVYNIKLVNKELKSLTFEKKYDYNNQSYNVKIILKILKKEV